MTHTEGKKDDPQLIGNLEKCHICQPVCIYASSASHTFVVTAAWPNIVFHKIWLRFCKKKNFVLEKNQFQLQFFEFNFFYQIDILSGFI